MKGVVFQVQHGNTLDKETNLGLRIFVNLISSVNLTSSVERIDLIKCEMDLHIM